VAGLFASVAGQKIRRIGEVLALDEPMRLKAELLTVDWLLPLRHRLSRNDLRAGGVWFGADSFKVDRIAYFGVCFGWYDADYLGATVIDIGAHKGYYATHALRHGARLVISCEPEKQNIRLLRKARARFADRWILVPAAIAGDDGQADLWLNTEATAHSLLAESDTPQSRALGRTVVRTMTLASLLSDVDLDGHVILKLDAEGVECDVICGTSREIWEQIDEIFFEWHSWAPCIADDLVGYLCAAGFRIARRETDPDTELLHLCR